MKKIRSKVMILCLFLGILVGIVVVLIVVFVVNNNVIYKVSNGIIIDLFDSIKGINGISVDNIYGVSKVFWVLGVNFNVNIDVLGIVNKISGVINVKNFNG